MTRLIFTAPALGACALVAALTGCGGKALTPSSATAPAGSNAGASSYKVLYNFHGRDGSGPVANLIAINGTLYGTTTEGGTHGLSSRDGVVFSITTSGKEQVLHDFGATRDDGTYPQASLIEVNGTLYGTTGLGNPYNTGTVYRITTSGEERVLYSFGEFGPDGMGPSASLINVNGTLYSTTNSGGSSNLGTVFSVTTDGKAQIVHSFGHPYRTDGQIPASRLLDVNGTLYGTTYQGGIYGRGNHCGSSAPCPGDGTVFSVSPAGKVRVLHSFGNGSDGVYPEAGLIRVNGTLYGTTAQGGETYSCGTVFSITTAGTERVLHSFAAASTDGCGPAAGLISFGGRFYGTTAYGGAYGPLGTVFSIERTGGGERILHSFGSGSDGKHPVAALHELNGTLYGTTQNGGTANHGTVFVLRP
ncbi:MAG: choice-of-anchor tandem repeat GloVer-containing protein [Candidatus Cybelea sp.]